jgi:putative transposase
VETIRRLLKAGSATPGPIPLDAKKALKNKLNVVCYCLMPNHYHVLVRQIDENGITEFMHKLNTSYTKYFNIAHKRTGRLFEYTFKAVHVETDEQLLHLSRYIHLNPLIGDITKSLREYSFSSYPEYLGLVRLGFCRTEEILGFYRMGSAQRAYERFVMDQADYAKKLHELKKHIFDGN